MKKISKNSQFIDNTGATYSQDKIVNKENKILIIYTHGLSLTKCYANQEQIKNDLINYLKKLF